MDSSQNETTEAPPQPAVPPKTSDQTAMDMTKAPTTQVTIADMPTYEKWIETETKELVVQCNDASKAIADNVSMEDAANLGIKLKEKVKDIAKTIDEQICAPRRAEWQKGNDFRRRLIPPLEKMVKTVETAVGTFKIEQERKRRAEEEARLAEIKRRQEEAARKEAERKEQERLRQLEHERQVLEAKINHAYDEAKQYDDWFNKERDRKEKEAADKKAREKREEEARLAHAEAAVDAGEEKRGDAILETQMPLEPKPVEIQESKPIPKPAPLPKPVAIPKPEPLPVPEPKPAAPLPDVATPEVAKVSGVRHSVKWHGVVTNVKDLMQWTLDCAKDPDLMLDEMEHRELPFLLNMAWVNAQARKRKDQLRTPGIKAVPEDDTKLTLRKSKSE